MSAELWYSPCAPAFAKPLNHTDPRTCTAPHVGRWRNLDVAVKTMLFSERDGLRQDKAVMEAAVASSVVHPNVVCVYHYDIKPVHASATHGSINALCIEEQMTRVDWKMFLVQVRVACCDNGGEAGRRQVVTSAGRRGEGISCQEMMTQVR